MWEPNLKISNIHAYPSIINPGHSMKGIDWDSESSIRNLGYVIEITAAAKPVIRE